MSSVYRVIILGSSSSGKSTLLHRLCNVYTNNGDSGGEPRRPSGICPTLGAEFSSFKCPDNSLEIQLWDTSGDGVYTEFILPFITDKLHVALVVFELASETSLAEAVEWCARIEERAPRTTIILVGNKSDRVPAFMACESLTRRWKVAWLTAVEFAHEMGYQLIGTSARDGAYVKECMNAIVDGAMHVDVLAQNNVEAAAVGVVEETKDAASETHSLVDVPLDDDSCSSSPEEATNDTTTTTNATVNGARVLVGGGYLYDANHYAPPPVPLVSAHRASQRQEDSMRRLASERNASKTNGVPKFNSRAVESLGPFDRLSQFISKRRRALFPSLSTSTSTVTSPRVRPPDQRQCDESSVRPVSLHSHRLDSCSIS